MTKAATRILAQLVTLTFLASCTSNTAPQAAQTTPHMNSTPTVMMTITPIVIYPTQIVLPTESAADIAKRRQQRAIEKDTHQKIWDDARIDHYQFTLVFDRCNHDFEDPSYLIEVHSSVSIIRNSPSTVSDDERICIQRYDSMDKLYQEIDQFIQTRAYTINIRYDTTYAYPNTVDVKLYPPPVELDRYIIHIRDFKVLP